MTRIVLTTVGTSFLQKLDRLQFNVPQLNALKNNLSMVKGCSDKSFREWNNIEQRPSWAKNYFEQASDRLSKITDFKSEIEKPKSGGTNRFSAEITSLYLMELERENDKVVLLASDSPEGVLAALLNQDYISGHICKQVETHVVQGLSADDFNLFKTEGTAHYASITRYYHSHARGPESELWLNITGGFKALLPYSTYLSIYFHVPLFYVFEESPDLVRLDPWPFSWSEADKERLYKLLKTAQKTPLTSQTLKEVAQGEQALFKKSGQLSEMGEFFLDLLQSEMEPPDFPLR